MGQNGTFTGLIVSYRGRSPQENWETAINRCIVCNSSMPYHLKHYASRVKRGDTAGMSKETPLTGQQLVEMTSNMSERIHQNAAQLLQRLGMLVPDYPDVASVL